MSTITRSTAIALAIAATTFAARDPIAGAERLVPLPGAPTAAIAADVDRDGALDVLVAVASGPRVALLRGDGGGGFAAAVPLDDLPAADGSRLLGLTACDVDLDGDLDILGAGSPATVWFAADDGTFGPLPLGDGAASHVATADIDGDGDPDVVLVTPAGVAVLHNDGGGNFVEVDTRPTDAVWPVRALRTETDEYGATRVIVSGGATGSSIVFVGGADGLLRRQDVAVRPEPPVDSAPQVLVRADLDRDGFADEVAAAPGGAAALVVRLAAGRSAAETGELGLRSGSLRHLRRATGAGVRALVRAHIPAAATGLPTRLTLGDPAGPAARDLAPGGWTAETDDVDIWRAAPDAARMSVVVDRARGTVTVSATRLVLPVVPEDEVEVAVAWGAVRAVSRSSWTRDRRGDLVYRRRRAVETDTHPSGGASLPLGPGERPAAGFVVSKRVVGGETVTLIRDRASGRIWRLAPDGSWRRASPSGRLIDRRKPTPRGTTPTPPPKRATVDLNFHGLVDGSDEIRIDAGGATWKNRHWGVHWPVTLNGVEWAPRKSPTLENSGKTRFLPPGVDFGSARLVSHSGRDLLALEVGDGQIVLKVSDSPNGPGMYDAVIRFETVGTPVPMLDVGLLAHLPLGTDTSDRAVPKRQVGRGDSVRIEDGAAQFDGKGWLDLPHFSFAERPFSFAMWVRVDGDAETMGLVEQRAANKRDQHLHLMLRRGQRPFLGFYMDDVITSDPVPRDGAFHHLVFQYTGEEKEIWMDGKRVAHRRSGPYRGTAGSTRIGKNPGWNNVGRSHLVGAMRDVRIYARSLSRAEVEALAK